MRAPPVLILAAGAVLLAPGTSRGAQGGAPPPRFYPDREAVVLDVDPHRVVVRTAVFQAILDTPAGRLRREDGVTIRGAGVYRLPVASPAGAVAAARALAGRPGVSWASPVYLAGEAELIVPGRVLAKFRDGDDPKADARAAGLRIARSLAPGQWVLTGDAGSGPDLLEAAAYLVEEGIAEWAHPDFLMRLEPRYTPNDTYYPNLWHLDNRGQLGGTPDVDVNAPEGWDAMPADARLGHPDVIIAVVDSGVDPTHVDLHDNMWTNPGEVPGNGQDDDGNFYTDDVYGWDFVGDDPDPTPGDPCDDHGVSVAGVAAGRGDNGMGVDGACARCRIMGIRLLDPSGFTPFSDVADAFRYAARNGAAIINNSWGPVTEDFALPASIRAAIDFADDFGRGGRGTAIFWAAGNDYPQTMDRDGYASYERVTAVGAINDDGRRSQYSETGQTLDLVAPSNDSRAGHANITTTQMGQIQLATCQLVPYDQYFGGTSAASPLAAGVGGLVLSAVPAVRPDKLRKILMDNADTSIIVGYDPVQHGAGAVRADLSVADVMSGPTFDRLNYECGNQAIVLSVRDASSSGSVIATVSSGQEPAGETVTCTEVAGRAGLFEGTLPTEWSDSPVQGDGILVVGPADTLTAEYRGIQDTATGTCAAAGCFFPPLFDGLKRVEDSPDCSFQGPTLYWDPAASWGGGAPRFYNVYRSTNPNFDPDVTPRLAAVDPSQTQWTDFFAAAGTTYTYIVRAENDESGCNGPDGGSQDSNTARGTGRAGTNDVTPPVTGLRVRTRPDGVSEILWDDTAGATSYDLYRGPFGGGPFSFSPSCFSPDLAPGTVATDGERPGAGSGFYYLATVETACGPSEFGPADVPRPSPAPCP